MAPRQDLGQNHSLPFTCEITVSESGLLLKLGEEFWLDLVDHGSGISVFDLNVEAVTAEVATALHFYQVQRVHKH